MKLKPKKKSKLMKLGPITIGGRRDGSGYQHSTASIVITPEDGDTSESCMARATEILVAAFAAAEAGVENRVARAADVAIVPAPAPAPASKPVPSPTFTGKVVPAALSTPAPVDADGLKRRVDAWRKALAESELSEADFLSACGVHKPEDLRQLNQPITRSQLAIFVADVAEILKNSDNVKV